MKSLLKIEGLNSAAEYPIYGHVRFNFNEKPISPYLDVKAGYVLGDNNYTIVQPSLGVSMPVSDSFAIDFGLAVGINIQKANDDPWDKKKYVTKNLALTFGFEF